MEQLIKDVQEWAKSKGIDKPESSGAQILKVYEEFGELCGASLKKDSNGNVNMDNLKDAIGDTAVTLIILAAQQGVKVVNLDALECDLIELSSMINSVATDLVSKSRMFEYRINKTLANLSYIANQYGVSLQECLQLAYDVIKNRKGKTIDGTFIKDEPKEVPQGVDLAELKAGHTVKFMNGTFDGIDRVQKCSGNWHYKLYFSDGTVGAYMHDGKALRSEVPHRAQWDIIEIIKA